jgi:hypothetical protein
MRGETEWTGFQTIHFPRRKIYMDENWFGQIFLFFLWNRIFLVLSLLSVVDPEWFIPDANFKKGRRNSGKFYVYTTLYIYYTLQKHLGQSSWRLKLLDENGSDPLRFLWNLVHKLQGFARNWKIQNITSLWPLVIGAVQILKITITFLFLKISLNS